MAHDAAPKRKLGRDDAPNMYDNGETMSQAMGVDAGALLKKIEAGDALSEEELAALRQALGAGEGTDEQIKSGPLNEPPPPPAKDEHEKMRDELRAKGFSEDDVHRILPMDPQGKDQFPPDNAASGKGMGGRTSMSMDEVGRRVLPQRGDRLFSVGPSREEPPAAIGMDAAAVDELDRMFGTGRIGHV